MIKKFLLSIIAILIAATSYADTAKQVDFLLAGYRTPTTDIVLGGGKVWTFYDGTSTMVNLFTDKDQGGTAPNPIILDSSGKAEVFGNTVYKFVIYDSDDNIIETLNGLEYKSLFARDINGIDNFAALRASSGVPTEGQVVTILGHTTIGDGGGGDFYWDSLSTTADDDLKTLKLATIDPGRFLRLESGDNIHTLWGGGTATADVEKAIALSETGEKIVISGGPDYDETVDWNGRPHETKSVPFLLNSFTWSGAGLNARMTTSNGYLYLAEYLANEVAVFSLADPRSPTLITSFTTGSQPRHIEVIGQFAFVACHGAASIEVYDLIDVATPVKIGTIGTGAGPKMFNIIGGEIYVVCASANTVEKYSFSMPTDAAIFESTQIDTLVVNALTPLAIDYNGSGLFAVGGIATNFIDIIDIDSFSIVGTGGVGGLAHPGVKWINKTQLLVTDTANSRLYTVDCKTLTPVAGNYAETSGNPEQIQIVGNIVYTPSLNNPATTAFLDCFDITDAAAPVLYKSVPLSIEGAGFLAYYTDGVTGYMYVNGHFAPYNIDIVETLIGNVADFNGIKEKAAFIDVGYISTLKASLANLSRWGLMSSTKITAHTIITGDNLIRVGAGSTITFNDPAAMPDRVIVIKNVDGALGSTIVNPFAGFVDFGLGVNEAIIVVSTEFAGTSQWDIIGEYVP